MCSPSSLPARVRRSPASSTPWLALPDVEARLRWWSALAGLDLLHLGTEADADEIKDTARTQPLLVAAALLAAEQLPLADVAPGRRPQRRRTRRRRARRCAHPGSGGHPRRGPRPGDGRRLRARTDRHGRRPRRRPRTRCWPRSRPPGSSPANRNGAGQIVAAGSADGLEKFAAEPPAKARVIPLAVAGAFHTPYMAPAETALGGGRRRASRRPTRAGSCCPTSTAPPSTAAPRCCAGWSPRSPRRCAGTCAWRTLADLGVTAIIELPPAGTLAGLAKRALKGIEIVTLNTPDDLPAARDLIARHAPAPTHEPTPQFSRRGRRDRRQLHAAPRASTRAPRSTVGHGHRPRHHPPGPRRSGRARIRRTHRVARPPRRPGRAGPAARSGIGGATGYMRPLTVQDRRDGALPARSRADQRRSRADGRDQRRVDPRPGRHRRRRRIADSETVADMAAAAAGKALANSGLTAADIDLVIVATCSSVDRCPNVATRVAAKLGIAAPGRVRPQHRLLRLLLRAGQRRPRDPRRRRAQRHRDRCREALRLHRLDRPVHRGHLRRRRRRRGRDAPAPTTSRPASARCCGAPTRRRATRSSIEGWRPYIQQAGQTVFRWATFALPALARQACERAGVDPSDLGRVRAAPGQPAHHRTAGPQARRRHDAVIARDIVESGNTSAASIPLALSKLLERREVPSGAPDAAVRLRRRPHLRRAGRPLPVTSTVPARGARRA